jgi:hypothetical protein
MAADFPHTKEKPSRRTQIADKFGPFHPIETDRRDAFEAMKFRVP